MNNLIDGVEFVPVESSNVEEIGYHEDARAIFVRFKGGSTYQYDDCSPELWAQMQRASSVGKFVHANLKSKPTERVEG